MMLVFLCEIEGERKKNMYVSLVVSFLCVLAKYLVSPVHIGEKNGEERKMLQGRSEFGPTDFSTRATSPKGIS